MSYNQNYPGHSNALRSTFQYSNPGGTQYYLPPPPSNCLSFNASFGPPLSDEDCIARWERRIVNRVEPKVKKCIPIISEARKKLRHLVALLEDLKIREKYLTDNYISMTEEKWQDALDSIKLTRAEVDLIMMELNDQYMSELQHNLSKRSSKRLRLKKLKLRKAEERKRVLKERAEKSRKIDENLQKMKNDLDKIKQAEEEKLEADVILRDVFRRKHDAKKCIEKLEALMKLRRARASTARGRGEHVSEADGDNFNSNIEKLIATWKDKLAGYEREECGLRCRLSRAPALGGAGGGGGGGAEEVGAEAAWREAMFGAPDAAPQRDFAGDFAEFVAVRSKWDAFISEEGSAMPVGWLLPQETSLPTLQD